MKIRHDKKGQSFFEFSFAIIMVVLLMVGMVKAFLWSGRDLVYRRQAHERVLTEKCDAGPICALRQLRPVFFTADDMRVTVNSNIFGP